ncbi:TM0106 family RecB-like putative nuclease [Bradyrhizobium aeschynomenes]|uniref:TM0106 family RecB-like putative nuclease n=1 Tax=Bradyrhizobium aeschynomenes TaxID=2734909 RepID=UPI0015518C3C|nr:TM0106 family RecB-like putative nuclease [Bradyrhizobium aeschynomenes]NPV22116.1 TM0106 family RecB-like putative nuclease [Bradyrhizobium aeschynomenes]
MTQILSASRLNDFLGCPHQVALWLSGIKSEEAPDPTLELIRAKGFEHEAAVLAHLERQYGPAVRIPDKGAVEDRQEVTLEAMRDGAPLIYQGAFIHGRWLGFPDFLVRHADDGGKTLYLPEDAKLARKAKAEHLLQLGIYAKLLEHLAGIPVTSGAVHVAGGSPQRFDLRRTRHILQRLTHVFEGFVDNDARSTRAVPCAECAQCDYKPRCEAEWRAADSPFFVAGITAAQVVNLEAAGVRTLAALADHDPVRDIDGIGRDPLARLIAQAGLQRAARESGKQENRLLPLSGGRGFHLLPEPDPGDLFFDMEGDALYDEGLEYLFGVWGDFDGKGPQFRDLWAHNHADEKTAFEAIMRLFVDQIRRHPNAHIYHYAQYEPVALKRLAMRYATMEAELDELLRAKCFVDLYRVVRQAIRAPTEGYSLKDLEQLYRPKRDGAVTNAAASLVEYERWRVTGDNAILDALGSYNEDDCVSTAQMRDWLIAMRPANAAYGVAAAEAERSEMSENRRILEVRKQDIAARVRASTLGDARVRDLIAELLWFHQRSQKPGWWAVFERESWTDDEFIEDSESLGALVRDASVPPTPVKRSADYTYTFPVQDTKLRAGNKPKLPTTRADVGTIISIDPEEGRIVIRRGLAGGAPPNALNLISAPMNMRDVPLGVMAFAERFAAGDAANDRALIDFLMRAPPRLKGVAPGAALQTKGDDATAAALRAVAALDSSYLFIQGPPGTGKTYTAAEAIILLLEQGHRIGVASNSHKAIHTLLEEVEKSASRANYRFAGAKRGNKDDTETHFRSNNIQTVLESEQIGTSFRLVGGTVFHFCREDQRGTFDFLVVDEAGQVSLGNLTAMAACARNLVLVGDQMQLPQPVQGVHPGESGLSSLDYLLQDSATVPADRGIFLDETRRLHPELCAFISDAIYDGRLQAHPSTKARVLVLKPGAHPALKPAGVSFAPVAHEGCTQSSVQEAEAIAELVNNLMRQEVQRGGVLSAITPADILVVAPYNMQVNLLRRRLPKGVQVGTVDKFQGKQAAVVIVSMATSRGEDAPRGTEFLFNPNRFNVAISRAQCLALVVHGTELLDGAWSRIDDLQRLDLFARAESL